MHLIEDVLAGHRGWEREEDVPPPAKGGSFYTVTRFPIKFLVYMQTWQ